MEKLITKSIEKAISNSEHNSLFKQLVVEGSITGEISPPSSKIKLIQIVLAIDGDIIYNGCGLGLAKGSETHPRPLHDEFVSIRKDIKNMLNTTEIMTLREN